eukprot:12916078-Alexandrium_andersonii.AAC.1
MPGSSRGSSRGAMVAALLVRIAVLAVAVLAMTSGLSAPSRPAHRAGSAASRLPPSVGSSTQCWSCLLYTSPSPRD